jgi:GTP cyclohydrolase I
MSKLGNKLLTRANGNLPLDESDKKAVIEKAAAAYAQFLDALQFDWKSDTNSADTPRRVAKAFVNDLISGCYSEPPNITAFDNEDGYDGMVCQNNIKVTSLCSHHHAAFTGVAHVAYIPSPEGKVIGLSKLNRIVDWFSRRPQIQEGLTSQIHDYVNSICEGNKGVAVLIECKHTCCSNRGIKHDSTMRTAKMSGAYMDNGNNARAEFYKFVEFSQSR